MILTKQTIITWASLEDHLNENLIPERELFINDLIYQEKTDGNVFFSNSNLTASRQFIDEVAAQEYINFITALATTHNCTIVSALIEDYTA